MRKYAILIFAALVCSKTFAQDSCPTSSNKLIHVVQKGETLYGISKKYNLSLEQLITWNNISENNIIQPCQELNIQEPLKEKSVPASYEANNKVINKNYRSANTKYHIVQEGETYYGIATRYGYTLDRLMSMNKLEPNQQIVVGQELKINDCVCPIASSENKPVKNTQNVIPASYEIASKVDDSEGKPNYDYFKKSPYVPFFYKVDQSETVSSIGELYGIPSDDIRMMNNIKEKGELKAGQKILLEDRNKKREGTYYFGDENMLIGKDTIYVGATQTQDNNSNTSDIKAEPSTTSAAPIANNSPQPTKDDNVADTKPTVTELERGTNDLKTSMSDEELQMVKEINLVRSNPKGYVQYIEDYINHLKLHGDMGSSIQSAKELIGELKSTSPLSILQPMQCVYMAAQKHGLDQKKRGDTDHQGSDGSWPWDRVLRECSSLQDGNENLVGGPDDIRRAVILLLVDDGIPNRGHRKTMLQPNWKYVACYKVGTVGTMPNCWVQNFGY